MLHVYFFVVRTRNLPMFFSWHFKGSASQKCAPTIYKNENEFLNFRLSNNILKLFKRIAYSHRWSIEYTRYAYKFQSESLFLFENKKYDVASNFILRILTIVICAEWLSANCKRWKCCGQERHATLDLEVNISTNEDRFHPANVQAASAQGEADQRFLGQEDVRLWLMHDRVRVQQVICDRQQALHAIPAPGQPSIS